MGHLVCSERLAIKEEQVMKVTMLSRASVLIDQQPISICADPWFIGEAFNEPGPCSVNLQYPRQDFTTSHIFGFPMNIRIISIFRL